MPEHQAEARDLRGAKTEAAMPAADAAMPDDTISLRVDRLAAGLEVLEGEVERLGARSSDVRFATPANPGDVPPAPQERSDLGNRLEGLCRDVQRIITKVGGITDSLDL